MEIQNLYELFEIEFLEMKECPIHTHKHNFFEIVYIVDGTGVQCINKNNQQHYHREVVKQIVNTLITTVARSISMHIPLKENAETNTSQDIMRYSDLRMNEIAFEFGFTDESHLTRTFKKHKGVSPSEFRKHINSKKGNSVAA